jgi:hypothetical protein
MTDQTPLYPNPNPINEPINGQIQYGQQPMYANGQADPY